MEHDHHGSDVEPNYRISLSEYIITSLDRLEGRLAGTPPSTGSRLEGIRDWSDADMKEVILLNIG